MADLPEPLSNDQKAPLSVPAEYERLRQRALERYEVLDTDPEFAFDDLTQLAALVCQAPISYISLIDQDRQWLKAKLGLDFTETPREIAFCNYVVAQQAPIELPDTQLDPRFVQNPLVTHTPHARFYAGVPLRTPDNYCIGTICVMDTVPRELTDGQRQALATIAEQVMAQLELKLRNRQLETGYDRLTRANQRLDQFTAMVSHDLKAPLSSLLTLTDLLIGDARNGDAEAVCEALQVMSGEVGRMQTLLNGLLQFARSTRPGEGVENVDTRELVHEIIRTLPGATTFTFDIAPTLPLLHTARIPLRQVLVNLLTNAVRYHPTGRGHIQVSATPGPGPGRHTFRVTDDGAGIPAHQHERVFQLFQRGGSPGGVAQPDGSGIGLATVRQLVEDHGGTVGLTSAPGQGATFAFSWEASAAH